MRGLTDLGVEVVWGWGLNLRVKDRSFKVCTGMTGGSLL